jgi:hypothetical protein
MMMTFKPLTDEDLTRIFDKYVKNNHTVDCTEYHTHGFDCVNFKDEQTMTIERLRLEVVILKRKLEEIVDIAKK